MSASGNYDNLIKVESTLEFLQCTHRNPGIYNKEVTFCITLYQHECLHLAIISLHTGMVWRRRESLRLSNREMDHWMNYTGTEYTVHALGSKPHCGRRARERAIVLGDEQYHPQDSLTDA